ncbi:hypothetical protein LTR99_009385 [Exophiala xenobiotica]|uniref:Uncharacterized protein n=1 Tax=Vermiconidia calcicola TaxID=1690605 RepID=A0AAV9PX93_9PEZI|nr:hypothetical protein H2202_001833 [Exophiala xenobiotica]KAK5530939.1 hypothetical protein LTR25_008796 [Vermiconidia calcicola]KAK5544431.1 hypothetical protein LTR23_004519 [Chaetothyriales sp. CCFEE 6169]KAK5197967.1 hypothetical protein LTR92_002212 [Exophiala xenobiotica]KAK5269056.1 hypothetical protein LTR96_005840 [Exophiala xenobiotica]
MEGGDESAAAQAQAQAQGKTTKRDRFKGALARTKSKFKKNNGDDKNEETADVLSDDVNEFLAAGRTSTSSWTSSGKQTLHSGSTPEDYDYASLDTTSADDQALLRRPSTSDLTSTVPRQSPRRIVVPRIDVSSSQRWPGQQPIGGQQGRHQDEAEPAFLRPDYHSRSQSATSLTKRKGGRARGLSVTFIDDPPVVIGEGGDDAPTPPVEISKAKAKAKARARSVSPVSYYRARSRDAAMNERSTGPINSPRGHHPPPANRHEPPDVLKPRGLRRAQTGMSPPSASPASGLDREFEMTLRLGGASSPAGYGQGTSNTPQIVAPKPVRPAQPPPAVIEGEREDFQLEKIGLPSTDLKNRKRFREGDVLRMHHDRNARNVEEMTSASTSSNEVSPDQQKERYGWV